MYVYRNLHTVALITEESFFNVIIETLVWYNKAPQILVLEDNVLYFQYLQKNFTIIGYFLKE
jgi:hypothetical protein